MRKVSSYLITLFALAGCAFGQVAVSLMPSPCPQFIDSNGKPLAFGKVYTYQAGTTTPQATYTDSTGTTQNTNPIVLNAGGFPEAPSGSPCGIWLAQQTYKISLETAFNVPVWTVDNVSDPGFFYTTRAVLLNPVSRALQTVQGPLGADYFQQATAHVTSPGVRVSILDPKTQLDTANNPPAIAATDAAASGNQQVYQVPDPGVVQSNFVLNPGPQNWQPSTSYALNALIVPYLNNPCAYEFKATTAGTSSAVTEPTFSSLPCDTSAYTVSDTGVVWTSQGAVVPGNQLDCTATGLTCKRTAYFYMEGGGCNNTTANLGWDNFGTNSPVPFCLTGTNIQKGAMAFPSAATYIQELSNSCAASLTCTKTGVTIAAGHVPLVWIAVDGSKTVSTVSDGTNSFTKLASKTSGTGDLELWYYNNTYPGVSSVTITVTYSAGTPNSAIDILDYDVNGQTGDVKDLTANNSGTGTAVTTGTTASTSQAVELVAAGVMALTNPTVAFENGWNGHSTVAQSTNITLSSEGLIQQAAAAQSGQFTLGSSQTWASLVATIKVNVGAKTQAQRQFALPNYFLASSPVSGAIKWRTVQTPTGTVNTELGAAIVCTADGSTDDPAFNAAVEATAAVNQTPAVITTTALNSLSDAGCAAGNLLHYQVFRDRYNANDTFEGYIYMLGASLQFGITQ